MRSPPKWLGSPTSPSTAGATLLCQPRVVPAIQYAQEEVSRDPSASRGLDLFEFTQSPFCIAPCSLRLGKSSLPPRHPGSIY